MSDVSDAEVPEGEDAGPTPIERAEAIVAAWTHRNGIKRHHLSHVHRADLIREIAAGIVTVEKILTGQYSAALGHNEGKNG